MPQRNRLYNDNCITCIDFRSVFELGLGSSPAPGLKLRLELTPSALLGLLGIPRLHNHMNQFLTIKLLR